MAKTLSKEGINNSNTIQASHVSQSIDALTGASDYDITISGSLTLTGSNNQLTPVLIAKGQINTFNISSSGNISSSTIFVSNNITSSAFRVSNNATIGGTLNVTNTTTLVNLNTSNISSSGNITSSNIFVSNNITSSAFRVLNNATVGGTLNVNGATLQATGSQGNFNKLLVSNHSTSLPILGWDNNAEWNFLKNTGGLQQGAAWFLSYPQFTEANLTSYETSSDGNDWGAGVIDETIKSMFYGENIRKNSAISLSPVQGNSTQWARFEFNTGYVFVDQFWLRGSTQASGLYIKAEKKNREGAYSTMWETTRSAGWPGHIIKISHQITDSDSTARIRITFRNISDSGNATDGQRIIYIDCFNYLGSYAGTNGPSFFRVYNYDSVKAIISRNLQVTGRIGIGTGTGATNPQRLLHISSPNGTAAQIQLGQASQRDYYIGIPANSQNFEIYDAAAGVDRLIINSEGKVGIGNAPLLAKLNIGGNSAELLLKVSSSTQADILSVSGSGRVGIGTTSPVSKVHISDTISSILTLSSPTSSLILSSSTGDARVIIGAGRAGNGDSLVDFISNPSHSPSSFRIACESGGNVNLSKKGTGDFFIGNSDNNPGNIKFYTHENHTVRLFISSSGNVGIGTITPINTLQVNGGITATSLNVSKSNGTTKVVYTASGSNNIEQHFLIDNVRDWVIGQDGSDNKFKISSANSFDSSYVRLTISSSGNVGIGTTSPQGPLHIKGTSLDGVTPAIFLDTNGNDPNEPVDIRLASENAKGIRIIASSSLSGIPGGAAISVYSNTSTAFGGHVKIDSGNTATSAIIFRTANNNGALTERMQIAGNGTVSVTGSLATIGAITSSGAISSSAGLLGTFLTLTPYTSWPPLPNPPAGSLAISGSGAAMRLMLYNGTSWNAV
jgi:hypothetical protein